MPNENPIPIFTCTIDHCMIVMPEQELLAKLKSNEIEKEDYTMPLILGPGITECSVYRKKENINPNNGSLIEVPLELYDGCGEKIKLFLIKDIYGHSPPSGSYC